MKRVFTAFIYLNILSALFAGSWETLIPNLTEKDKSNIADNKYGDRSKVDYKQGLELLPTSLEFKDELFTELKEYNPELCVELLFVLDKPAVSDDEVMVYLLNNFRAFSYQAGLEYFSYNRNKMYPLIKKSYFVDQKKKAIDDPVVTELPSFEELTYFQNDTTFSSNYYKLITRTTENNLWIRMENLDTLRVMGLVKALDAGEQRVDIFLDVVDDKVLLYTLAQIKTEPKIKKVLKWNVNVAGSFKRRMWTVVDWYRERISQ